MSTEITTEPRPEIKSEIRFTLTSPISYSHQGEQREGSWIALTAPTSRHSRQCAALKQAFFRSVPKDADPDKKTDQDPEITGSDVIQLISASLNVDLADVLDVAKDLFSGGIALIEGEGRLTKKLIDDMSQEDFEAMTGQYLVDFTLASELARMSASSSRGSSS